MATALETFRLLISDTDTERQVLDDATAGGFLAMFGVATPAFDTYPVWSIRRAAAEALDAIAVSETLVGKVIRTKDLSTDGTKVAAELRAQADRLRARADDEEDAAAGAYSGLSVVEFSPWPWPV